jgi:hypothetical protein
MLNTTQHNNTTAPLYRTYLTHMGMPVPLTVMQRMFRIRLIITLPTRGDPMVFRTNRLDIRLEMRHHFRNRGILIGHAVCVVLGVPLRPKG